MISSRTCTSTTGRGPSSATSATEASPNKPTSRTICYYTVVINHTDVHCAAKGRKITQITLTFALKSKYIEVPRRGQWVPPSSAQDGWWAGVTTLTWRTGYTSGSTPPVVTQEIKYYCDKFLQQHNAKHEI